MCKDDGKNAEALQFLRDRNREKLIVGGLAEREQNNCYKGCNNNPGGLRGIGHCN